MWIIIIIFLVMRDDSRLLHSCVGNIFVLKDSTMHKCLPLENHPLYDTGLHFSLLSLPHTQNTFRSEQFHISGNDLVIFISTFFVY